MPQIIPFIVSIGSFLGSAAPAITAISGLTSMGMGIANAVEGGGGPQSGPTAAAPTPPTAAQNAATELQNRQQQAMIARQGVSNELADTGGSLSPGYYLSTAATNNGQQPFNMGGLNSIFGMLGLTPPTGQTDIMGLANGGGYATAGAGGGSSSTGLS